ncbi:MAG: ABC transporter ATP-binding protein [Ruminiclostridium sp.]|nr:ABC transporter ATP-binding protein [Ruminiclostridium sp.]
MLIELKSLYRTYQSRDRINNVEALKNVNLSVAKGEYLAITGASGSGKSTLMNILGLLDTADSGSYYFDGTDITELSDREISHIRNKSIGFVFQSFNLIPSLTTLENVALPLEYRGVSRVERMEKAKESLDMVGLSSRLFHKPSELSGGQQQRVAIARAIAGEPPVILADEPCGNLDSKSGNEIMGMLKTLNQSGRTVILITHDSKAAMQADRMVRVEDGTVY